MEGWIFFDAILAHVLGVKGDGKAGWLCMTPIHDAKGQWAPSIGWWP